MITSPSSWTLERAHLACFLDWVKQENPFSMIEKSVRYTRTAGRALKGILVEIALLVNSTSPWE